MMKAKTASTIQMSSEMMSRKKVRARGLDRAHEDGSQRDPHERRKPAPDHGDGRAHDGRRAGDGGVVVPPEDVLARGNEIDAVLVLAGRYGLVLGQGEDAAGQETRVEAVPHREQRKRDGSQQCGVHGSRL
jgi:hypothetical protein